MEFADLNGDGKIDKQEYDKLVGSPESVPDAPSGAGQGYFSGQAEVDPFAECDSKIGQAGVSADYTQYRQAGNGWMADAFSKPSNSEYRKIADFGKVENEKYWALLGGGCGGNKNSGGFCITWTDEVKDEILSWTKEDMVNPNDPAKGSWDGILLDFEYTVWGKDAGTNLKEIATHLKGLGVAVGLSAPGYGPKKGASCPDSLSPPCTEPYTPFGITCTAAMTGPGRCPRAPLTPDQKKDPTPSLAGLSWDDLDVVSPLLYGAKEYDPATLDTVYGCWGLPNDSGISDPICSINVAGLSSNKEKVVWSQFCEPLPTKAAGWSGNAIYYCPAATCKASPGPVGTCVPVVGGCAVSGCANDPDALTYTDKNCKDSACTHCTCQTVWAGQYCKTV
jgi:hypothetical protein